MLREFPASTPADAPADARPRAAVDVEWAKAAQAALGSALFAGLLGGAVYVLGRVMVSAPVRPNAEPDGYIPFEYEEDTDADGDDEVDDAAVDEADDDVDEAVIDEDELPTTPEPPTLSAPEQHAATLLGVNATATEDQIRSALRARLATSRLHPDHGGDGQEATRLIAAKNLLIERARRARP